MKRSAGGLLARGEQLCEGGRRWAARHQRATDGAGRRPATKVVAGGCSLLAAISEQPERACLLSAGSSLVIAGSGSLMAGSSLA